MKIAWGARLTGETKGLDVMGIRALDQNIEASLTNGITTISPRARYTSILAWSIGQYLTDESSTGQAIYDEGKHAIFDNRVRFLVFAATVVDPKASRRGVLGLDFFVDDLAALTAGQSVRMPDKGNFAVFGTYFGPASAIGLVENRPIASGITFGLTIRGTRIFEERKKALEGSALLDLLRNGGELDYEMAVAAVPHFSLKRAGDVGQELEMLREAVTVPWVPGNTLAARNVADSYQRMADTRAWIDRELSTEPASANHLIARNYDLAAAKGAKGIELDWASFEWHRRAHFALELLLSATTDTLLEKGSLSISQVVAEWASVPDLDAPLAEHWNSPVEAAALLVKPGRFAGSLIRTGEFGGKPHQKALGAFELLVTQNRDRTTIGISPGGAGPDAPALQAMNIIAKGGTLQEVLTAISDECVAQRHVFNTMRKMGNQQDCSLRFYPDGPVLVPTDLEFSPGYSGSRLQNTMRVLADLGLLAVGANGAAVAGVDG